MAFITYRAKFFDERGNKHGNKSFKKKNSTFKYGSGSYNVDIQEGSFEEDNPIFFPIWKRKSYFYNINNSNPIKLNAKAEPPISPELYNINLETEVARKLNDLSNSRFSDLLTPRNIIILLAIIALIYYLKTKGTI